jgi:hypothetical protein
MAFERTATSKANEYVQQRISDGDTILFCPATGRRISLLQIETSYTGPGTTGEEEEEEEENIVAVEEKRQQDNTTTDFVPVFIPSRKQWLIFSASAIDSFAKFTNSEQAKDYFKRRQAKWNVCSGTGVGVQSYVLNL